MITPNIFKSRNDWNVISSRCKQYKELLFYESVAKIIEDATGHNPFVDTSNRRREICQSRQLYLVMLRNNSNMSQSDTGSKVGKDHATVIHAVKTINNLYDTDKKFRILYDEIDNKIKHL